MHTYLDCVPCFVRQALDSARLVTKDDQKHQLLLREILKQIAKMDLSQPPPAMARRIHKSIRKFTGIKDPYAKIKKQSNEFALTLYPKLKRIVNSSKKPFLTAVQLAIAGNIIDFGVHSAKMEIDRKQIHDSIENALKSDIDLRIINEFKKRIKDADSILYLADNAGEIVFDRILIEEMPLEKITVAVKGHPIINDATIDDAKASGIFDMVKVIENGSDAPGTILNLCSASFRKEFERADLIISKGQGNYETLSSIQKNIFFLFKSKCPVISNHIGMEIGKAVILRNREEHELHKHRSKGT